MQPVDRGPTAFEAFEERLARIEGAVAQVTRHILQTSKLANKGRVHEAEWHVCGLVYHCRNLIDRYAIVGQEAVSRAFPGVTVIVMHEPAILSLWFEFYALVNLARITLDNLRLYLSPAFQTGQLPKSVRSIVNGNTDCPVYQGLEGEPIFEYLLDVRDCLVHYRTFATTRDVVVVEQGFNFELEEHPFLQSMARAEFRRLDNEGIAFNIFLPDQIFERDENSKRLVTNGAGSKG